MAATSSPVNGQNSIDTRFVSRFNVIGLTEPDNEDLSAIFDSIIKAKFLEFSNPVKECTSKLTKATLGISVGAREFGADACKISLYLQHEGCLSYIQGHLLYSTGESKQRYDASEIRYHEVSRVLFDRLVTEEDLSSTNEKVESIILQNFPETSIASLKKPLAFGDF